MQNTCPTSVIGTFQNQQTDEKEVNVLQKPSIIAHMLGIVIMRVGLSSKISSGRALAHDRMLIEETRRAQLERQRGKSPLRFGARWSADRRDSPSFGARWSADQRDSRSALAHDGVLIEETRDRREQRQCSQATLDARKI